MQGVAMSILRHQRSSVELVWLATIAALLGFGAWMHTQMIGGGERSPPTQKAGGSTIACQADPIDLGWWELGQRPTKRAAAAGHLRIICDGGSWRIADVARDKKIDVRTSRWKTLFPDRWKLMAGDEIDIGNARIHIETVTADALTWSEPASGRVGGWTNGTLDQTPGLPTEDKCARELRGNATKQWLHDFIFGAKRAETRLFSFGGSFACPENWPLTGERTLEAALVTRLGEAFYLAPGRELPGRPAAAITFRRADGAVQTFSDIFLPLDDSETGKVERIVLGRTHYEVSWTKDALTLKPSFNQELWYKEEVRAPVSPIPDEIKDGRILPLPPAGALVSRAPAEPALWSAGGRDGSILGALLLPGLACLTAACFLVCGLSWWRHRRRATPWLDGRLILSAAGLAPPMLILWCRLFGTQLGLAEMGYLWIVGWGLATLALWSQGKLGGRGGQVWTLTTGLALAGMITLSQLGAGALNLRWHGFGIGAAQLMIIFAGLVSLLGMLSPQHMARVAERVAAPNKKWRDCIEWSNGRIRHIHGGDLLWVIARLGVVVLVVGLLFWEVMAGGEQGVGGIQPAELAKVVLVVFMGQVALLIREARLDWDTGFRNHPLRSSLRFGWFALLALGLIAAVLTSVGDYSPGVILFVFVLTWAWRVRDLMSIPARDIPLPPADFLGRLQAAGAATLRGQGGIRLGVILFTFLAVATLAFFYSNPESVATIPHLPETKLTRVQVWADIAAYREEGYQVINSLDRIRDGELFGASAWFGINGGTIMDLPEVQNDFIGAFVLNRFGGVAGLTLVALQTFYIWLLFRLADDVQAVGHRRRGDADLAWTALSFVMHGCAVLVMTHWIIAWGNVLGLLPVMGQPMTWIAAGNSHLGGVGMTTAIFSLVCAWIVQEDEDSR
ncbi:FtsW/RodA/SpoVE family cell cycle protein [Magnetospirillum sp. 15-1]|uniref:FtsW/RodA/SpoVE family cell cycle protein n=1 Tax=Magnetospirillum sp. 15-1 TaxID=1979370 RepID=UPI001143C5DC|nr:FtsW/RodA/SpoVE family cell cycle protein [Magnetospirillum sp. 15-1]